MGRYFLAMHTVAVLALDQVIPFDLSTPIEVFTRTRLPDGRPAYQLRPGPGGEQHGGGAVVEVLDAAPSGGGCRAAGR